MSKLFALYRCHTVTLLCCLFVVGAIISCDHLLFGVLFIVSIGSLFPLHMQGDQNARVSRGNPHASSTEVEETYQKEGVDGGDGRRFELEL